MHRIRLIAVFLMALGALIVVSVSAAAGGEWFLAGSPLSGSAALSPTTTTVSDYELLGGGQTVECAALSSTETFLTAKSTGHSAELRFTGCQSKTSGCRIASPEIKSNPLTLTTSIVSGTETKTVFKTTNSENVMAKIKFEAGCPAPGNFSIKAEKLTTTDPKGTVEAAQQELRVNSSSELSLGGSVPLTLIGASKLSLVSGSAWSFH